MFCHLQKYFHNGLYIFIMVHVKEYIVQNCKYNRSKSVEKRTVFKIAANKLQNWPTIFNVSNDKKNYYICDKHFLQQYIKYTGRNIVLATDAVATPSPLIVLLKR
uniref:THAP-type domain-containing protein n=1 Tax=Glossina austeni TaxID=7395 RepID=A0A1A9V6K9_GLOAU